MRWENQLESLGIGHLTADDGPEPGFHRISQNQIDGVLKTILKLKFQIHVVVKRGLIQFHQ